MSLRRDFVHAGQPLHVQCKPLGGDRFQVSVGGRVHEVVATRLPNGRVRFELEGRIWDSDAALAGKVLQVRLSGQTHVLEPAQGRAKAGDASVAAKSIEAPMTGTITKVLVKVGDAVEKGQTLVVLTAMKMEHKLAAALAGKVAELQAKEGAIAEQGTVLVRIE